MTCYVDDMFKYPIGKFGRMKMSHMIADNHHELIGWAIVIGVDPKWIQYPYKSKEHFDVAMGRRELALKLGAVPITFVQSSMMTHRRRIEGVLGRPEDAEGYYRAWMAASKRRPENRK